MLIYFSQNLNQNHVTRDLVLMMEYVQIMTRARFHASVRRVSKGTRVKVG